MNGRLAARAMILQLLGVAAPSCGGDPEPAGGGMGQTPAALIGARSPAQELPPASAQDVATALLLEMTPPCPKTRGEAQKEGATRVFVEVVVLEADATRLEAIESVDALLSSPDAQITSRHVLVEDGVPMRFDGAQITARVAPAASHVRLDLVLDAQAVQTTVSVGDGQRTVLPGAEDGKRTITTLVVPTIVRSEADLRRLYECKKQRAVAG